LDNFGLYCWCDRKSYLSWATGGGILATTLLGIIGAFVGGTLLNLIQTGSFALAGSTLSIPGIFVAIIGAIVFIFLWGLVTTSRPD
jgi:uncharacterized membrane protein YeaQ/YmgE (transglycosylase-associated protein family)